MSSLIQICYVSVKCRVYLSVTRHIRQCKYNGFQWVFARIYPLYSSSIDMEARFCVYNCVSSLTWDFYKDPLPLSLSLTWVCLRYSRSHCGGKRRALARTKGVKVVKMTHSFWHIIMNNWENSAKIVHSKHFARGQEQVEGQGKGWRRSTEPKRGGGGGGGGLGDKMKDVSLILLWHEIQSLKQQVSRSISSRKSWHGKGKVLESILKWLRREEPSKMRIKDACENISSIFILSPLAHSHSHTFYLFDSFSLPLQLVFFPFAAKAMPEPKVALFLSNRFFISRASTVVLNL